MRRGLKQAGCLIIIFLTLYSFVPAQNSQSSSQPSSELQELNAALALKDVKGRVASLQRFLEIHPNSERGDAAKEALIQSLAQIAESQLGAQDVDRALASFRQALGYSPIQISDSFFENTLIRIPLAVAIRGYRPEALSFAREIEARSIESPLRLGALGEFYISLESPDDAVRVLESAARIAPDNAKIHRTLGSAYRLGLKLDEAIAEYQRVVSIDANDKRAYYELANLHRSRGAYEVAIKLYRRQLELDPTYTASSKGLALTYLAQGKTELAEAELKKIRSADEVTKDYYLQTQLAFYYLMHGLGKQARQAVEKALKAEPRYSWARIAAAEVDLADGNYFEAERHLLTAKQYGNFPTLEFTLGKVYLSVEDFDDSLAQFAKAFSFSSAKGFKTKLGGVLEVSNERLADLLVREHQAAIFLFEPSTSYAQFRVAESLVKLDAVLRGDGIPSGQGAEKETGREKKRKNGTVAGTVSAEIEKAAQEFVEADVLRRPFRALYVAQWLAQSGQGLDVAVKLAQQALEAAEAATEPESSLPDYPNYDRKGRLQIFRGRAEDARGWALMKLGRTAEAIEVLKSAVASYSDLPEGNRARWHLAAAKESAGDLQEALDLYIASYEPPKEAIVSDVNRIIIESLYRKVHGSLDGLDEQIGKPVPVLTARKDGAASTLPMKEMNNQTGELKAEVSTSGISRQADAAESKVGDNTGKGSELGGEVHSESKGALPSLFTEEQRKFNIVLPKSPIGRAKPDLQTEDSNSRSDAKLPVPGEKTSAEPVAAVSLPVLPEVKISNENLVKIQVHFVESPMILTPNDKTGIQDDPVPPSPSLISRGVTRHRFVSESSAQTRPRRVSATENNPSSAEILPKTRKRRVTSLGAAPRSNP